MGAVGAGSFPMTYPGGQTAGSSTKSAINVPLAGVTAPSLPITKPGSGMNVSGKGRTALPFLTISGCHRSVRRSHRCGFGSRRTPLTCPCAGASSVPQYPSGLRLPTMICSPDSDV